MSPQESLADYYAQAREIAKIEKELAVEKWIRITIYYFDGEAKRVLKVYDIPWSMRDRWEWVFRWRRARFQCQYPRQMVCEDIYIYSKIQGVFLNMQSDLDRFISAKAQVSRQQRIIDEYIELQRADNIFFDETTDAPLLAIKAKLAAKRQNVLDAESRLIAKVKEYKALHPVTHNP